MRDAVPGGARGGEPAMRVLWWRREAHDERPADVDVLELRVHGVANTPPAAMLGLAPTEIEQVEGDELGSFWCATPAARAVPRPADDPRAVPPGVRREAYSWGAMARLSTIPGLGKVTGTIAGLTRALWVLIIPFGFVNVAYWTRDADEPAGRRSSAGGGLVRLFGLLLTLLWVATVTTMTLGVVGAQCFGEKQQLDVAGQPAPVEYVMTCTALPGWMGSWARWTPGTRTVALSLVAILAVLLLAAVGSTGQVRYERRMSWTKANGMADAPHLRSGDVWPMLARRSFWTHARSSQAQWCQHLAAAFALLAGMLAWHHLYRDVPGCRQSRGFGEAGCLDPDLWATEASRPWMAMVVLALVVGIGAAWRTGSMRLDPTTQPTADDPGGAPDAAAGTGSGASTRLDVVLVVAGAAVLTWTLWRVGRLDDQTPWVVDGGPPFVGLAAVPTTIVAAMVLLAIASAGLRAHVGARVWVPLVVGSLLAGLVATLWQDGAAHAWGEVLAAVLAGALFLVVLVRGLRNPGRRAQGWGGRGPFVMLSIAAGVAMVLSAAAVLGLVAWLQAPAAAENATVPSAVSTALEAATSQDTLRDPVVVRLGTPQTLVTPEGYQDFAIVSVAVLLVLAVLLAVLGLRSAVLRRDDVPDVPVVPPVRRRDRVVDPDATPPSREAVAVQAGRHRATLAHRAERLVGALALFAFAALVATLRVGAPAPDAPVWVHDVWQVCVDWSTKAVVAGTGLIVASVVLAGSKKSLARPWGLLWDLMCFLPRAAHPFAPPCYAERVVPELRSRIDSWLGDDGNPMAERERERRRVVISAHSLGGVVAVAALFGRWDGVSGPFDKRVGLLTYGTQLRAYFGRFFPELLGPVALGTAPVAGARVWLADPWASLTPALAPPDPERPVPSPTLAETLDAAPSGRGAEPGAAARRSRWRSLWRRTDFIGFPVDGYAGSRIDSAAAEVDERAYLLTVAAHSGYPATPQYREELDRLVTTLRLVAPEEVPRAPTG
ncbi:hypothetical protein [Cellulomonas composti]|uniref:Uncharacterized protein n=1 Tax=Cellulomonas composti TaxID=266130 RepID=A0A511J5X4_9CELL|nr:hypothetical protein [Cellulomonas composti]GEL93395.1 hypothetical protein CCO02nite_00530 [Cellulomonas composti]